MRFERAGSDGVIRPVGCSAGAVGLAIAWLGGATVARLTGATPVVIVLASAVVWAVAGVGSGWWAVRITRIGQVVLPAQSTQGEPFPIEVAVGATRPVWVEVTDAGGPAESRAVASEAVASGMSCGGSFAAAARFARRGLVDAVEVSVRTPGVLGLVWWERRVHRPIGEHLVAPRPFHGAAVVERHSTQSSGDEPGSAGAVAGDVDGVRPWRDGDNERVIHWASTLRTGELVVRDRRRPIDQRWVVRARPGTRDPDLEAGAARSAVEQGLRSGSEVWVVVGDGEPIRIPDLPAARRWSALVELGPGGSPSVRRSRWRRLRSAEPLATATPSARWWAAGATLTSLVMLAQALGYGLVTIGLTAAAVLAGAYATVPALASGRPVSALARTLVAVGSLIAFAMVGVTALGSVADRGVLGLLRGPLPQILAILIALHGFECRDRRTVRVGLGISAVVLMYASGFRVDGSIAWWFVAWAVCFAMAMARLPNPSPASRWSTWRAPARLTVMVWSARLGGVGLGALATVVALAVVPIPDGPARLTLPTFLEDRRPIGEPGAIVGPDGTVRTEPSDDSGRAPAGQAGGYNGFADSMDTSVRGALSEAVVMRVRAPRPDFWRGQTFSRFDGRRWYADENQGRLLRGPNIEIRPAFGDFEVEDGTSSTGLPVEQLVQTYHLEQDLPNVVFAAAQPSTVVIDADVWARPDGALRASTVLTAGSVYTVVSHRPAVTAELLRADGRIEDRLSALGLRVMTPYLELPASTSPETIALAEQLAEGQRSTYDVIRSYERWLGVNVAYDLDAPLPDPGEDAVHDFLFDSRRGFCEQIASALTVMLRSQGVPARVATGYVPGERDEVAGVWVVRGRDAHAWVEVWFPSIGWQAFDPTASVPLAGEARRASIGDDLARQIGDAATANPAFTVGVLAATVVLVAAWRTLLLLAERRRRGRWGLLQDRFAALAARRGATARSSNPSRAAAWTDADADADDVADVADDASVAELVARRLDQAAFDPRFRDDDSVYADTRRLVGSLAERHK
jgi:hypothetical protein